MIDSPDDAHPNCAVIDIGSNSVRMVLYDRRAWPPLPVYNDKTSCQLALGLEETGNLDPDRMQEALGVLSRFAVIITQSRLDDVLIFATSASRDAGNGQTFIDQIETMFGQKVTILPGDEEARLSAHAVWNYTESPRGLVGDLGGGSLELAELMTFGVGKRRSLPLGALRLMETSGGDLEEADNIIRKHCAQATELLTGAQPILHLVGGAWRSIAKAHMTAHDYPLRILQSYTMTGEETLAQCQSIIERTEPTEGVSKKRQEALPYAALLLTHIIKLSGAQKVIVSAAGLREGAILDRIDIPHSISDRLREGCARIGGVKANDARASALAAWLQPLFHRTGTTLETMIEASCLLAASARRAHPTYRAQQAFFMVLRSPILTVSHDQRAFLALSILFRFGGSKKTHGHDEARHLLDPGRADLARTLGLAQRLADKLSAGLPQLIEQTALNIKDETLILTLPHHQQPDETTQARLAELAASAGLAGCRLVVNGEG